MNKPKPFITVLIPCYNAMPYLPEALDSIINQTYKNLEILCINDGSTDNTGEVLEEYAKKDSKVWVVHNESNIKLIKTLNKGVQLANGEYIARMDADDIALPNRIEKQLEFLLDKGFDLISSDVVYIDEEGNNAKTSILKNTTYYSSLFASFFITPLVHPASFGKKEVFASNPYLQEEQAFHTEDYELWSRLLRNGYKLANIPEVLLLFRINTQSISRKFEELQKRNFALCAHSHYEKYFEQKVPLEIYSIVVNRFDKAAINDNQKAFSIINQIKKDFLSRHDIDKSELHEIKNIILFQKLDILIQLFKKGSFRAKVFALLYAKVLFLKNFFNKELYGYLRLKG